MKRTLFWLRLTLVALTWLFIAFVLGGLALYPTEQLQALSIGKWIVGLLAIGHAMIWHHIVTSLFAEYKLLRDQAEPFIVTGTGHRA